MQQVKCVGRSNFSRSTFRHIGPTRNTAESEDQPQVQHLTVSPTPNPNSNPYTNTNPNTNPNPKYHKSGITTFLCRPSGPRPSGILFLLHLPSFHQAAGSFDLLRVGLLVLNFQHSTCRSSMFCTDTL